MCFGLGARNEIEQCPPSASCLFFSLFLLFFILISFIFFSLYIEPHDSQEMALKDSWQDIGEL